MSKSILSFILLAFPVFVSAQCSSTLVASGLYGPAQGASGVAQYAVFMPQPATCYNGNIILFAHGYVPVGSPSNTWLSQLALPDGTTLPALANRLGFGFAASSFSKDGLAILQGKQDTKALTNVIATLPIPVSRYFVAGASEGGLITALSVESDPTYSGGLAVCGPVGSLKKQINYTGDVRVLFDYFLPNVLATGTPGESAINIPPALIAGWTSIYVPKIRNAVNSNPLATLQLLNTAKIPIGLSFANAADAIISILAYNVFATTDAQFTLLGNPFDNITTVYRGSFNDVRLNTHVARFAAANAALISLQSYETNGLLANPLVTLHNLADPLIPFWQETLYRAKTVATGSSSELAQIPSLRYGHCNVNGTEAAAALLALLIKAGP